LFSWQQEPLIYFKVPSVIAYCVQHGRPRAVLPLCCYGKVLKSMIKNSRFTKKR